MPGFFLEVMDHGLDIGYGNTLLIKDCTGRSRS
jgi:hypothetical protein